MAKYQRHVIFVTGNNDADAFSLPEEFDQDVDEDEEDEEEAEYVEEYDDFEDEEEEE